MRNLGKLNPLHRNSLPTFRELEGLGQLEGIGGNWSIHTEIPSQISRNKRDWGELEENGPFAQNFSFNLPENGGTGANLGELEGNWTLRPEIPSEMTKN